MIKFTDSALEHLKELYQKSNQKNIKISVTTKGCSGNSYDLKFIEEDKINPLDEKIFLEDSFIVILDFKSSMWLLGTEIDWVSDKWNNKFEFRNKNIEGTCGCGESFYFKNSNTHN